VVKVVTKPKVFVLHWF